MTDLPRVLVVTNLWPRDGSYRGVFVEEQVQALRRLGYPVDVEVVAQARGRADYLGAVPRVRRRARTGGYDLVHIHYGLTALAARYAGPVPRVLTLHGSDVRVPWQALATRLGSGGVVARIYVSAHLAERAGDPAGIVIPGGVDFTRNRRPGSTQCWHRWISPSRWSARRTSTARRPCSVLRTRRRKSRSTTWRRTTPAFGN